MATPVIMPKFEMTQENATVVKWLLDEGDPIEQGDPILEVETDKVVMEVESPATGVLGGVKVFEGDVVPVTEIIAYILAPGEAVPEETPPAPTVTQNIVSVAEESGNGQSHVRATPLAQRVAAETGVEISQISTTNTTTRITRQDVEAYLSQGVAADRLRATPAARRLAREHNLDLAQLQSSGPRGRIQAADIQNVIETAAAPEVASQAVMPESAEVVPLAGMRRTIANRMQQSYQTTPHIMLTVEVDMTEVEQLRQTLNTKAESLGQPRISVTAILVKMCAYALKRHPWVNASLHDESIHFHSTANIGVAVALPEGKGLIVPVIREAENLGLAEISSRMNDLVTRARAGDLLPTDVTGGTFTITNLGMFGINHFTAIINSPESAILAVGQTAKRPVVIDDEIVICPMMNMTLALDHRVLDGAAGAQFLQDVVKALEQPSLLLW